MRRISVGALARRGLVAAVLGPCCMATGGTPQGETLAPSLHGAGVAFEQAALEVTRGFLRDDAQAARAALDLLWRDGRDLTPEDERALPAGVGSYNRAFRATISSAREALAQGDLEGGFLQFVFAQKTCRFCHTAARAGAAREPASGTPRTDQEP